MIMVVATSTSIVSVVHVVVMAILLGCVSSCETVIGRAGLVGSVRNIAVLNLLTAIVNVKFVVIIIVGRSNGIVILVRVCIGD